jgi:hypothetical protein
MIVQPKRESFGKLEYIMSAAKESAKIKEDEKMTESVCINSLKQVVISQRERIEELEVQEGDLMKKQK